MKVVICQPGKDHGVTLHEDLDEQQVAKLIRGIPRLKIKGKGEEKQVPAWVFEVYDNGQIVSPIGRTDWGF